jgi:two-component system CheB/CheR fusion protein
VAPVNVEVVPLSRRTSALPGAVRIGRRADRSRAGRSGADARPSHGIARSTSASSARGGARGQRAYLQSIIQELEAANEELQSANEEILSSNEELQSTNEELDTAKEELQSTNES